MGKANLDKGLQSPHSGSERGVLIRLGLGERWEGVLAMFVVDWEEAAISFSSFQGYY